MATARIRSDIFQQAWMVMSHASDPQAQARLTELEQQSQVLSVYHPRQEYLLGRVVALTQDLQREQASLAASPPDSGAG